jgi:hypothetical protein
VNGGRNYNGPKVKDAEIHLNLKSLALVKLNYMLETPPKLLSTRLKFSSSKNLEGMGTISRKALLCDPQRLYVQSYDNGS